MPQDTQNLTHLIVGMGEVGKALHTVLSEAGLKVDGRDVDEGELKHGPRYDVLHVCLPCGDAALFARKCLVYGTRYLQEGGLIIVHSTVPVGTTDILGDLAVHSPVRGVHPDLAGGIRTFVKYFGGARAREAAMIFAQIGIEGRMVASSRDTEALKLWDTTQYGWNIVLQKSIHAYCKQHGLDFDLVYADANKTYNEGYATLGMGHVARPILKHVEGKIGGHCVVPNAQLLGDWVGDLISGFDEGLPVVHTEK